MGGISESIIDPEPGPECGALERRADATCSCTERTSQHQGQPGGGSNPAQRTSAGGEGSGTRSALLRALPFSRKEKHPRLRFNTVSQSVPGEGIEVRRIKHPNRLLKNINPAVHAPDRLARAPCTQQTKPRLRQRSSPQAQTRIRLDLAGSPDRQVFRVVSSAQVPQAYRRRLLLRSISDHAKGRAGGGWRPGRKACSRDSRLG